MKTIAFVAAVAFAAVTVSASSTPAFAQDEAQGSFGTAKVTYDQKTDRYCFKDYVSGSLAPVTHCRSKGEWADAGLTISHTSTVQLAQR